MPNPAILDLHERGLVLDIGHGAGSFSYQTAEAMLGLGVMPDVISSDIHQMAIQGPMFDLPTTFSKFLNLGHDAAGCHRTGHLPSGGGNAPPGSSVR